MLMIAGGWLLALIRFSKAIRPPNVVAVSAQVAISMAALGAAALDHSASRIASASFPATTPGLLQLLVPLGGAGYATEKEPDVKLERPRVERKVFQSTALYTSVSSITTMVWPCPEIPALKRGLRL